MEFVTDDPAFDIWHDREDLADVAAYVRKIRQPRYNREGSRNETLSAALMRVDTDVLIWHLSGCPNATRRLDELGALMLSAVSYLKCAGHAQQGRTARLGEDARQALCPSPRLHAARLRVDGVPHPRPRTADGRCPHPATALEHQLPVLNTNVKHFGAVSGLQIEAFAP